MDREDKIRYARMLALPQIGEEGMRRLREGRVALLGCGALGSVCGMYLAGAGVGNIRIADFDTIDVSNLQRQLFYSSAEVGKRKSETLARRMRDLNPGCEVECFDRLITEKGAADYFSECDFVIDATDNSSSKFMTDRICHELGIPYCIGGVAGFNGQVMSWSKGHVRYSEIFTPAGNSCGGVAPCSSGGVLGPAAGVVACVQSSEAIKHLTGAGEMLYDKLFLIDLLTMKSELMQY